VPVGTLDRGAAIDPVQLSVLPPLTRAIGATDGGPIGTVPHALAPILLAAIGQDPGGAGHAVQAAVPAPLLGFISNRAGHARNLPRLKNGMRAGRAQTRPMSCHICASTRAEQTLRLGRHLLLATAPAAPGRLLLAPRRHLAELAAMTHLEAGESGVALLCLARALSEQGRLLSPQLIEGQHLAWDLGSHGLLLPALGVRARALMSRMQRAPQPPWRRRPGHARSQPLRTPDPLPGEEAASG